MTEQPDLITRIAEMCREYAVAHPDKDPRFMVIAREGDDLHHGGNFDQDHLTKILLTLLLEFVRERPTMDREMFFAWLKLGLLSYQGTSKGHYALVCDMPDLGGVETFSNLDHEDMAAILKEIVRQIDAGGGERMPLHESVN